MTTTSIKLGLACAVLALATGGCGKQQHDGSGTATGSGAATKTKTTTGTTPGTATTATAAPDAAVAAAPPLPITQDQLSTRYGQCWGYFNGGVWDLYRGCYADDAVWEGPPLTTGADAIVGFARGFRTGFPDSTAEQQLTLIHGTTVVSITLLRGTNTAPMPGPDGTPQPPNGKQMGLMVAHLVDVDAAGKITREAMVQDNASLLGQLGALPAGVPFRAVVSEGWPAQQIVLARADVLEETNVAAYAKGVEAFNKHDLKAVAAGMTDDLVWSEASMPRDQSRAEMIKGLTGMWAGFSDMKQTPAWTWGAGEYVVSRGTMTGTNDGKSPIPGVARTGKKLDVPYVEVDHFRAGKVDKAWLFFDGTVVSEQLGLGSPPPAPTAAKPD